MVLGGMYFNWNPFTKTVFKVRVNSESVEHGPESTGVPSEAWLRSHTMLPVQMFGKRRTVCELKFANYIYLQLLTSEVGLLQRFQKPFSTLEERQNRCFCLKHNCGDPRIPVGLSENSASPESNLHSTVIYRISRVACKLKIIFVPCVTAVKDR